MKIIDNKKDYYDYLSGIYGIDELIVFDRRGSVPLKEDMLIHYDIEPKINHLLIHVQMFKNWSLPDLIRTQVLGM